MAKVKMTNIQTITSLLEESLKVSREEYIVKPSNELYSIIIDTELTLRELNKLN